LLYEGDVGFFRILDWLLGIKAKTYPLPISLEKIFYSLSLKERLAICLRIVKFD